MKIDLNSPFVSWLLPSLVAGAFVFAFDRGVMSESLRTHIDQQGAHGVEEIQRDIKEIDRRFDKLEKSTVRIETILEAVHGRRVPRDEDVNPWRIDPIPPERPRMR